MRIFVLLLAAGLCACSAGREEGTPPAPDQASTAATPGELVFSDEACLQCHSFQGKGGNRASSVSKLVERKANPVEVVSSLWNHAPAMWAGMREVGIVKSTMAEERAAQLVSYLSSGREAGQAGDPARGRKLFADKGCTACHGAAKGGAAAPASMRRGGSPASMVSVLWEHGPRMLDRMKERNLAWPEFSAPEMADLIAYLGSQK
jgi:mono/diheme cytochrome c family protein